MLSAALACGWPARLPARQTLTAAALLHRVFSMEPIEGYRPPLLSGHRDTPVAVFFAGAFSHPADCAVLPTFACSVGVQCRAQPFIRAISASCQAATLFPCLRQVPHQLHPVVQAAPCRVPAAHQAMGAAHAPAAASEEVMQRRAADAGLPPFALLTVARDSCLFTWSYTKEPPETASQPEVEPELGSAVCALTLQTGCPATTCTAALACPHRMRVSACTPPPPAACAAVPCTSPGRLLDKPVPAPAADRWSAFATWAAPRPQEDSVDDHPAAKRRKAGSVRQSLSYAGRPWLPPGRVPPPACSLCELPQQGAEPWVLGCHMVQGRLPCWCSRPARVQEGTGSCWSATCLASQAR